MVGEGVKKVIIITLDGGQGYTLEDADLWGLESVIHHALDAGYLVDNRAWGEGMLARLSRLRDQLREGSRGGDEEVSKRISLIMAELKSSQLTESVTVFFIDGKASVEIPQGAVILDAHITIPNVTTETPSTEPWVSPERSEDVDRRTQSGDPTQD